MPRFILALSVVLLLCGPALAQPRTEINDLEAARELFQRNLDAIRNQDKDAYLACYWQNSRFTRNGNQGPSFGYEEWAPTVGDDWPEVFDAKVMQLTWIKPGVVYGSYRYRVAFDGEESAGISERVFLETDAGWRIAVSTAFENAASSPPPPLVLVGAAMWWGGGELIENAVISIKEGKITCVGTRETCGVAEEAEVVDLTGFYIIPDFTQGEDVIRVGASADLVVLGANPVDGSDSLKEIVWVISQGEMRAASEFKQ